MGWANLTTYQSDFSVQLERASGEIVTAQKQQVMGEAMTLAVQGTPVDTGELRSGWHISLGSPTFQNVRGSDLLRDLVAATTNVADWAKPIYLQNNMPHAEVIEYGQFVPPDPGPSKDPRPGRKGRILVSGGFSVQAPSGVLGDVAAAISQRHGLARGTA